MSEEEILNVFENTGDFGKYYLGDYSNEDIAKFIRNILQENQQLKEQSKQRKKVIDKAIKQTNFIDEQLRKYVTPIPSKEVIDLLEILQKYKGE